MRREFAPDFVAVRQKVVSTSTTHWSFYES
jgi:hypothetical protein